MAFEPKGLHMIRDIHPCQPELFSPADFQTPFGDGLNPTNRWVRWAGEIPWAELAGAYQQSLKVGGRPAKPARLVIGALIIKHRLGLSDAETIEQLRENPYLQYFCGFECFQHQPAFAPTLFVKLRERLTPERFAAFEQAMLDRMDEVEGAQSEAQAPDDEEEPQGGGGESSSSEARAVEQVDEARAGGTLIVDASVAEQRVRYPNDVSLLDEARESTEALIDALWAKLKSRGLARGHKPRSYRERARRAFVGYSKKRRRSARARRRARREQLQYVRRNLASIDQLLDRWQEKAATQVIPLSHRPLRRLWIIRELYRQQAWLHEHRARRIAHRIVSLGQPHVRPIVRGRAGHPVEFGNKFSVSLTGGLACVDTFGFEAFGEAAELIGQCQAYRSRHGHYPAKVLADGAYGTRENRRWLTAHGIRFAGKPLGRPPKLSPTEQRAVDKQRYRDACERILIEGKFGQGKAGYGLAKIAARRADTSEAWVRAIFLVMNLLALEQAIFWPPYRRLLGALQALCVLVAGVNNRSAAAA